MYVFTNYAACRLLISLLAVVLALLKQFLLYRYPDCDPCVHTCRVFLPLALSNLSGYYLSLRRPLLLYLGRALHLLLLLFPFTAFGSHVFRVLFQALAARVRCYGPTTVARLSMSLHVT